MPIYEYRCDSCGRLRELLLKPGEDAKPACPSCRKRMRRVISPTAFILKGSGWYVTDYPSSERKKGMEAEKGPPAEKAEPAAGKAKPETKPKPAAGKAGAGKKAGKARS